MTYAEAVEIAHEVFPEWDDEAIDWAIWNRTGWPTFWRIPEDGADPAECLRMQLERYRDSPEEDDDDAVGT